MQNVNQYVLQGRLRMSNISETLKKELNELKQTELNIQKKKDELVSLIDSHLESVKKERMQAEKIYKSLIRR